MSEVTVLLRAATILGERLVASAISHDGRCTWLTHDVDETGDEPTVVEATAGPDLYQGTAGIGWALARLAMTMHDVQTADVARAALQHALAHAPADISLHGGRAGIAYAAADVGAALGDDDLLRAAHALTTDIAEIYRRRQDVGQGWDLMGGDAGVTLAFTSLGADAFTDAALAAARRLAAAAVVEDDAWSWPSPGAVEPALCGLAHGASGAAVALAAVSKAANTEEFDSAIWGALAYERSWFDRAAGWPDLRGLTKLTVHAGQRPTYPVHWCHGAAGVGIARLRVARTLSPAKRSLAVTEAAAATDVSTTTALRALAAPGAGRPWLANVSVCHGIGSVIELHLEAHAFTGDATHLTQARRMTLRALGLNPASLRAWDDGMIDDEQLREALNVLACGIPGAPEVPGLMIGTAGVISLLLRLAAPGAIPPVGLPT